MDGLQWNFSYENGFVEYPMETPMSSMDFQAAGSSPQRPKCNSSTQALGALPS